MDTIRVHWKLMFFEGILFTIFGCLAIALPQLATLGIELVIGWLFLIAGCFQLIRTFRSRGTSSFWWSLLSSLLSIAVGVILLARPMQGVLTLTLILAVFFLLEGITEIGIATKLKPLGGWGWLVFSGILALGMAVLIWIGWPGTAAWVIGLLVGINMLFFGFSMMGLAFAVRRTTLIQP